MLQFFKQKRKKFKFISSFLTISMIFSCLMVFQKNVHASQSDANNGDWSATNVILQNTPEAQLMVRVGDINNFGFGWDTGFNPFSGNSTRAHSFPWNTPSNQPPGLDRIMVVSGYSYSSNYKSTGRNRDGYTEQTSRPNNNVVPISLSYSSSLNGINVRSAVLQMFVDDFQPGNAHGITNGNVKYTATINDQDIPELDTMINSLDESGPIGRMITFQIPERFLNLVSSGKLSIKIDDPSGCTGDGYAIDFVKLLINPITLSDTANISGKVTDNKGSAIAGATVSAGGVVVTNTDSNGNYNLTGVPAGQALITASQSGYVSQTIAQNVVAGGGYTGINFSLSPVPLGIPSIIESPTTITNQNVTVTISYPANEINKYYSLDGGTTWQKYTSPIIMTSNGLVQAKGQDSLGNYSDIVSFMVSNIYKTPPTLNIVETPTTPTNKNVTINVTAFDNVAISAIKWESGTQNSSYFLTGGTAITGGSFSVSDNGTYTVYAQDIAGNTTVQTINVTNICKTPPTIALTESPTTPTSGNVTINVNATAIGVGNSIATTMWASGNQPLSYFGTGGITITAGSFIATANGTYTVYAQDIAGNATVQIITVSNIDTTGPAAPVVTGVTNGQTYGTSVTPSWIDVVGTTSSATLDGVPYTKGTAISADGNHVLVVTARKTTNGLTAATIVNFTQDLTGPAAPVVTGVANGQTYGTAVTPSWTDVAGTTSSATLDGVPYTKGTSISVDGNHVLVVTARKTTNGLTAATTVNFTQDMTGPAAPVVTGVTNGQTYGTSVTPSWTDVVGTISSATLDGKPYTKGTAISADGNHVLVVTATKTINGMTAATTVNFTEDLTEPAAPVVTGVADGQTYGAAVTPSWTDVAGTTSSATLDGAPYTKGTAISADGNHVLVVTATKTINGMTAATTVNFTEDLTGPAAPIVTGVADGQTYGAAVAPSWTDVAGTTSSATLDGAPYTKGTAISADGNHVLVVTATKTINGMTAATTVNFTEDLTGPAAPIVTGVADGQTYGAAVTPSWTDVAGTTSSATLDGAPYTKGTAISADGNHVLVVTATKTINGMTAATTVNFTEDLTGPAAPIVTGVADGQTYGAAVTPSWTDADGTTSSATLDGAPYTKGTAISSDGNHVLVVTATKTINGLAASTTVHFTLISYQPSKIIKLGAFMRNNSNIDYIYQGANGQLSAVKSISMAMAMIVDVESPNPQINLSIKGSFSDKTITFKKYELNANDNSINSKSMQSVTLSSSAMNIANSSDFSMQVGKKYIIVYNITPNGNKGDSIDINVTVDNQTTSQKIILNIQDLPELE